MIRTGVIFDIDGVLVDSNPLHLRTWRMIGREDGFDFPESLFQETFGQTTRAILKDHWHRPLTEEEIRRFDERKERLYRDMAAERLPEIPGAVAFLKSLHAAGIPLAVGSSGPGFNVDFVLETLGVKPYLAGWVSGTDVTNGKPAPDIFLAAAAKMDLPAPQCVVIDDSQSGILAARNARMRVVGFFSAGHRLEEYADVDLLVHTFDELSPEILAALPEPSETVIPKESF